VESLRELLGQVNQRRPRTQADTLRAELARAVELENYEKAAFLRDQLKLLQGFGMRSSGSKMRVRSEGRGNAN
jgi:protein-arginine kinase activator protein McsA